LSEFITFYCAQKQSDLQHSVNSDWVLRTINYSCSGCHLINDPRCVIFTLS